MRKTNFWVFLIFAQIIFSQTDNEKQKIEETYKQALATNDVSVAKRADLAYEQWIDKDKSVDRAADRAMARLQFLEDSERRLYISASLQMYYIDSSLPRYCAKVGWVREGIQTFLKKNKKYQGNHAKAFAEFLTKTENHCVGENLRIPTFSTWEIAVQGGEPCFLEFDITRKGEKIARFRCDSKPKVDYSGTFEESEGNKAVIQFERHATYVNGELDDFLYFPVKRIWTVTIKGTFLIVSTDIGENVRANYAMIGDTCSFTKQLCGWATP
jgi:hypothetical protein